MVFPQNTMFRRGKYFQWELPTVLRGKCAEIYLENVPKSIKEIQQYDTWGWIYHCTVLPWKVPWQYSSINFNPQEPVGKGGLLISERMHSHIGCICFTFTISFINISYWSTSSLFAPSVLSAEVPQQLQGKNPNLLDRHLFLHSKWSLIRPPDPLTSYLSCRSVGENVCSFSRYFGRMGLSLIGSPCLPSSQARVTSEK